MKRPSQQEFPGNRDGRANGPHFLLSTRGSVAVPFAWERGLMGSADVGSHASIVYSVGLVF